MSILGKIVASPTSGDTVIYKVPTGKQATVSVNAVNIANTDTEYTLSLIKTKDVVIDSLNIVAAGSGYTAFPTLTINGTSTTTATAAVTSMRTKGVSIVAAGSGYFPGNVLTITGGTFSTVCRLTVLTVDGAGAIQTVSIQDEGVYSVLPTGALTHSGGQGTGATFNLTYAIETVAVTAKGNGYDTATVTVTGSGTGASITCNYGVVTEVTDAIEYKTPILMRSVIERTGIPLAAGEMITASATHTNSVNVIVYGIEDIA